MLTLYFIVHRSVVLTESCTKLTPCDDLLRHFERQEPGGKYSPYHWDFRPPFTQSSPQDSRRAAPLVALQGYVDIYTCAEGRRPSLVLSLAENEGTKSKRWFASIPARADMFGDLAQVGRREYFRRA